MTTNEALTPQIAKNEIMPNAGENILTDEDYTQIFLIMLKHEFHDMPRFKGFIDEMATDMEIYGLIDNAEKVKTWVNAWAGKEAKKKMDKATVIASIKMALAANTAAARRYTEAEKAEHDAIAEIMEEYMPNAHQAVMNMLQRNARKSVLMHGPNASHLTDMIQQMIEKMS